MQKRFSSNYQFRLSYTYSRTRGTVAAPGGTDTITWATVDPTTKITDLHMDDRVSVGDQDRPHILSLSGTPFTLTDSTTDPNRNGNFEEPLPAGSYSGASSNQNAITVENDGGFNGARGPEFSLLSMRAAYRFKLPGGGNRRVMAYVDVFNVTNRANFNNPTGDRRDATFLIVRSIRNGGPTRTAQLNLRYDF